ncbi:MAG: LysM domain-containing protein [Aeromicrobium sp.]|uniref:LysM peptidoglycan-binding domain-containing protein n=1 Tax=Aeromicrobium sp. TaxID=1871063 RepID=UPI0026077B5E|nr:LysM domain-containing protein [Aeromicrobium sp.]MDF1703385.1 LysM domain-containing protein [Aeromicrobium sp.]
MSITHDELPLFDLPAQERPIVARPRHLVAVADEVTAPPREVPAGPVRLTRRGRIVLVVAALAIITALMVVFGSGTAATSDAGVVTGTRSVTVQPGETLWSIAGEANPGGDIRDTMADIVRLNSLVDGETLQMGTKLSVPVYATD